MKIKILALALSALALGFSACDDDDDDAIISTHPEKEIDGMSFTGKYQQVNLTTKDTTYTDGALSFAATDSAYVCMVTATVGENDYSYQANVVKTSNGFSFYTTLDGAVDGVIPIGTSGFNGEITNDGEALIQFNRRVGNGLRARINQFTFSNTKWK